MPRWIKFLIAGALLAALGAGVDWESLPQRLARLEWWPFALALLVTATQMPVNATKWGWSLRLHDVRLPWPFLMRASCTAYFFNNFLPSAIGGDVYRIYRTVPPGGEKSRAISAVLVERAVGLGILLANGAIGAVLLWDASPLARSYLSVVAMVAVAGLIALPFARHVERIRFFAPLAANLRRIARPRGEWAWLVVTSIVFQIQVALVLYLAFLAVGVNLSIPAALLITAAGGIASVLPISISGIGVVEGAIAGSAVALGVHYDQAVLAAIAIRLVVIPVSGACGIAYLWDDGARAPLGASGGGDHSIRGAASRS
jgi:glycosyltransferase 2 family protein